MTCSIFIASTTATCWPWRTSSPTATLMATMVPWMGDATPAEPSGPIMSAASSSAGRAAACSAFTWPRRARTRPADRGSSPAPRRTRLRAARRARFDEPLPMTRRSRASVGDVLIHPARVDAAGDEIRVGQDVAQERDVGGDAVDPEFAQRTSGARHRGREIRPGRMRDHLRQQRVECAPTCGSPHSRTHRSARRVRSAPRRRSSVPPPGRTAAVGLRSVSMLTRAWIA